MQGLGDKFEVGSGGLFPENLDRGIAKRSQIPKKNLACSLSSALCEISA